MSFDTSRISAMNLVSARIAPLAILLPALLVAFSWGLLTIFLAIAALFALRLFVVFPRVACGRCAAKGRCPNAKAMGIG